LHQAIQQPVSSTKGWIWGNKQTNDIKMKQVIPIDCHSDNLMRFGPVAEGTECSMYSIVDIQISCARLFNRALFFSKLSITDEYGQ
jgi:hypothetical protein